MEVVSKRVSSGKLIFLRSLEDRDCFLAEAEVFAALAALRDLVAFDAFGFATLFLVLSAAAAFEKGLGLTDDAGVRIKSEATLTEIPGFAFMAGGFEEGLGRRGLKDGLMGTYFWRGITTGAAGFLELEALETILVVLPVGLVAFWVVLDIETA